MENKMQTEDDFREAERERIISILTMHRSEIRVCRMCFDGYHSMMSPEMLRAALAPTPEELGETPLFEGMPV